MPIQYVPRDEGPGRPRVLHKAIPRVTRKRAWLSGDWRIIGSTYLDGIISVLVPQTNEPIIKTILSDLLFRTRSRE